MGMNAVVALLGLTFSMISIKLMSIVENAQVVVSAVGNRRRLANQAKNKNKVVVMVMGARKLLVIKIGIIFFGKISTMIFAAETMYPARVVEGATMAIMNTVLVSNKITRVAAKHSRNTAKRIKTTYSRRRGTAKTPLGS
jgi:hypothetical protein